MVVGLAEEGLGALGRRLDPHEPAVRHLD